MGLISGMVMGVLVGVAIMAGWSRVMLRRSRKRIAKAADIKVLGSLGRDDLRKLCGDNFPEWISFPQFEQVKWLNKHLSKLWPFVAEAATAVVKESVEPLLDDYRPPGIKSLKFSKFSLGTVSPKIEGIRIQNLQPGQIIMDIDFRWGGDPSIILAVDAVVASLPIQLKDLRVYTIIRVVFQLSEEIPCISAVVVALLADPEPKIQYTLKAIGGSLTAVPGLSDMIDDTVNSIVSDMLQWPHRLVVPLGVNVDTSDLELKPQGKLSVTVVKATSLKNKELIGKSDPYVKLYVRPMFKVKTKVIDDNLNPEWNETFELIVEDKETQSVIFEVYDEDKLQQDKRLGVAKLALNSLEPEITREVTLKLLHSVDPLKNRDTKDRGTLHLKVMYHPFTKEEQLEALEAEKQAIEERKRLKEAGIIGSTMDAVGGAASLVGSGVGAGVGLVGSGIGAVGSGLGKAGKFMGKTVAGPFSMSRKNGSSSAAPQPDQA
ncbi:calcium-dependent lipid-binding protein-like isoform X2 [Panicum virgatum]|uniref:calcium-dependent lipid-binding protein-like isoform X2 n=1 Tax=Panicum virgatum TaxID=38727 RepID=UPI0019D6027B|nr:calcium-dependent lipid-binding protein-like isoform X2 [Panicum virgatum]